MSGVYVYAVTRADHPLRLDGLRTVGGTDEPPRVVVHGSLAAVVSAAPPRSAPQAA